MLNSHNIACFDVFFPAVSCISRKIPEQAANKEEVDGKINYLKGLVVECLLLSHPLISLVVVLFFVFFQKCTLTDEDMMDAMQTAQPAQSSTELTELGKCLLKHEVGIMWPQESNWVPVLAPCTNFCVCCLPEHLHDRVGSDLHVTVLEGCQLLSPHRLHRLLAFSAAGWFS